jgi:hypothetical protein
MNLNVYLGVVRRYWYIVLVGAALAAGLAVLSAVRVGGDGLTSRQPKVWAVHEHILVTQSGCPICRSVLSGNYTAPGNLTTNAILYANLATSSAVHRIMLRDGKLPGDIAANAQANPDGSLLPIIDLAGIATSPEAAAEMASRGVAALKTYITSQQNAYRIPRNTRVLLQPLGTADSPVLVSSQSITRPIFVFLAVLFAVVGLAFIFENLRLARQVEPATPSQHADDDRDDDETDKVLTTTRTPPRQTLSLPSRRERSG